MNPPDARQRIDLWLWHARVARTRSAAAALVRAGHVRVDGRKVDAAGHGVRAGQVLTVALEHHVRVLRIVRFSERRKDATAASELFEEITDE